MKSIRQLYPTGRLSADLGRPTLLLAIVCLAGCGSDRPELCPVSGTVTLDGDPVAGAVVTFYHRGGRPATGETDAAGKFTLSTYERGDGAVPGQHLVAIRKVAVIGPDGKTPGPDDDLSSGRYRQQSIVPERYARLDTTDQRVVVSQGMGPVRIELKK